ncbi:MAG: response regulator [Chloroflexota bacterium]|nr:response regulator [Anaerolineae bacterium]
MKTYPDVGARENEHILVVDDEKDVVAFCLKLLALKGYEAQGASSGRQALDLAKRQRFDLLLTDIMMPDVSGLDLLAEIKTTAPDIAAVVMTGYGTTDIAIKALRAGARDFVTKPFSIEELMAAIEHALSQSRLLRENIRLKALVPVLEASQRFRSTLKLEQLLDEILETTAHQASADHGRLFLMAGDNLELMTTIGCEGQPVEMTDLCKSLAPILRDRIETFLVSDKLEVCPDAQQLLETFGVSSMLCLPLYAKDKAIGMLTLGKSNDNPPFDEGDVEVISILGNQAAVVIESARLFDELVRARWELEEWNRELEERNRELREARQYLVRAEKLAVIGKLGAGVAHELRNPLGVINNSIYYLNSRMGDADPKVKKHLGIMQREVARSNKIITDLMSFISFAELRTQKVDINGLVSEALARVETPSTVIVETTLQEKLPEIMLDSGKIQQVFVNLLINAIQAMSDGGKLTIATGLKDGFVQVAISDTGCGIKPQNMDRLFEPLFTTKAKGIGLGLAISRMLIENHGGHITAHNNIGEGATFVVALPTEVGNDADGNRS